MEQCQVLRLPCRRSTASTVNSAVENRSTIVVLLYTCRSLDLPVPTSSSFTSVKITVKFSSFDFYFSEWSTGGTPRSRRSSGAELQESERCNHPQEYSESFPTRSFCWRLASLTYEIGDLLLNSHCASRAHTPVQMHTGSESVQRVVHDATEAIASRIFGSPPDWAGF